MLRPFGCMGRLLDGIDRRPLRARPRLVYHRACSHKGTSRASPLVDPEGGTTVTDLLLKGGRVLDPSQGLDGNLDVAVKGGSIAEVAASIDPAGTGRVVDVSGKLVVPGLIDLHCHVYKGVDETGIDADVGGVRAGVTTMVDAGSAGAYTFGGFPEHIVPRARTRILCMIHIGRAGLAYMPEIADRDDIDVDHTVDIVRANRPLIRGVKVRAVGPAVPKIGIEMVTLAKRAAEEGGVKLMVHIGDPYITEGPTLTRQLLPLLRPGDILTHLLTGNPGRILDETGTVLPELLDAQERGVCLDPAMGRFNFSFETARAALDQGVRPSTISTDLTIPGRLNTVHSLTEMMSRFMALGLELEDVVRMVTVNPARALGMDDTLGSLAVGREADITVLDDVQGSWSFFDSRRESIKGSRALVPALTVRAGEMIAPDWGPRPWGWLPDPA